MERLIPNSRYKLIYKSGSEIEFETLEHIPEAKHLIRVRLIATGQETDLIGLLMQPWMDIVAVSNIQT